MEENGRMIESLIERATEYGKMSLELAKLKAIDKTSEVVSSFASNFIFIVFVISFLLFLNIGIALWFGEILGAICYGFFIVAAFYGIAGIFYHFALHKWVKKCVCNNFIKQVLN